MQSSHRWGFTKESNGKPGEHELSTVELDNYQKTMHSIDEILKLKEEQLQKIHQLKLSLFRDRMVAIHDEEMWADHIPKADAKILFREFMALWKNAFDQPFDNYEYNIRNEQFHFENWKATMMWDYRKNKQRITKQVEQQINSSVSQEPKSLIS